LAEAKAVVKVDEAVVARLTSHGSTFEMLVDSNLAPKVRRGEPVNLDDLLAVREVFKDAKKGERVSDERIAEVFGTRDLEAISRKIIRDGEIQLTTDQRRAMVEEKRKAIVAFISRNAVDPRTGYPHPPARVENALTEAKVRIDPFDTVESQVKNTVKEIRTLLPLRFEVRTIAVRIPPEFTGRAYGHVKSFGELKKEEWQKDGSWVGLLEIPVGVEQDFYSLLGKLTQGQGETKLIERR
jgi:ribosome maturation protein SDO1